MDLRKIADDHYSTLKRVSFRGFDVYDGLNSRIFRMTPFFRLKTLRLAWIQMFKRLPVNFRSMALVPQGYNPKGLALVIRGLINMYKLENDQKYLDDAYELADKIISQRASNRDYFCTGYDFFWQAKACSVPEFTPNMVVSTFTGHAFLDLYEIDGDKKWIDYTIDIGKFIEKELKLFESDEEIIFGYIPGVNAVVNNVNLMASAFFARLFEYSPDDKYEDYSVRSAAYTVKVQREDGAWSYGEDPSRQWVDNFHTGFNLVSLDMVRRHFSTDRWDDSIYRGLEYHERNHFLEDMTPKYYDTKLYPVDIHNFAQGVDTFLTFGYLEKAELLIKKAVELMWDRKKHFFYYQKTRWYTNKINYMRWSQAWMFYALTKYELSRKAL